MPSVLIRDVPEGDLDPIRDAAAAAGQSLQTFLRGALHAHAVHIRRQAALAASDERLSGRGPVAAAERRAVLDALHDEVDSAR